MIDEMQQPLERSAEQQDLCFLGDTSPIGPGARVIGLKLKRGAAIVASEKPDDFAELMAARSGVEESLNADFLTLHVSERYGVAWAERVSGERIDEGLCGDVRPLIKKPKFGRDMAALFFVLEHKLRMRQAEGYEKLADWLVTESECREAWLQVLGESLSPNANKARSAWDNALGRAQGDPFRWVSWHGPEERGVLRISPVVLALVESGFCSQFLAKVEERMAAADACEESDVANSERGDE